MKYASLNNSHNNCHRNYMNEIFLQRGPAGGSHVARVNFKTSRVGVYKRLSRRLCHHCRNLAEGGCLFSRFRFMRCRYFLGHVACWNLHWQGLYKYTGSDQSTDLYILRNSCHELFSILGDFYVSGTQNAEVTKSLISLFSVHVNYFVLASIVSWGTKLPYMVWQTVYQRIFGKKAIWITWAFLAYIQDGLRKQPKVCMWIDVWGMSAEIRNWWLVTPQFQVVLLTGLAAR